MSWKAGTGWRRCFRLTIATACRRSEVLDGRWAEIDLAARPWIIAAERTKSHREHRVPLSDVATDVLRTLATIRRDDLLLPGHNRGRPIAATLMLDLLGGLRSGVTIHGFRATFRSWCADHRISRELAEAALAHKVEDATERAYQRSDMLGPRRTVMQRWGRFLPAKRNGKPRRSKSVPKTDAAWPFDGRVLTGFGDELWIGLGCACALLEVACTMQPVPRGLTTVQISEAIRLPPKPDWDPFGMPTARRLLGVDAPPRLPLDRARC